MAGCKAGLSCSYHYVKKGSDGWKVMHSILWSRVVSVGNGRNLRLIFAKSYPPPPSPFCFLIILTPKKDVELSLQDILKPTGSKSFDCSSGTPPPPPPSKRPALPQVKFSLTAHPLTPLAIRSPTHFRAQRLMRAISDLQGLEPPRSN